MKTEQRLQPVAKIARSQERSAARVMGEMLRQAEEQQTQLELLISYRDEYFQNFSNAGQAGLSAVQLQDYQVFLHRLDTAIAQQRQQVEQSRQSCEQSKTYWRGSHNHSEMINKVVENRRQQAQQLKDSREQRELDDRSAFNHFGNH
ncbi:MAG TPA: flagellar export protein FliJ [Thiotrichales bacterium]|nr:flagellar export protein FliJ [Thiotrichales bacterium]